MTENNQPIQNQLQTDFEEAIAEKNKTIYRLEQERNSALSARAKMEKEVDDLKAEKQSALDKAERAEARYLRNTELKAKSQAQSQSLLNTLFGGVN
jgi:chromosome segregation ATPase